MKKELNSKSKRKWIIGGLAAFTSISLLTTGFAIWVVGVSSTESNNDVTVTVDTAQNKSIVFTMTLGDSIQLKESAVSKGKIVNVEESDTKTSPLTISYSNLQIVYGKDSGFENNYDCIKFSIAEPEEGETDYASVKSGDNKLTGTYARTGNSYTYLEAPDTIKLSSLTQTQNDSITTYSSTSGSLTFKWGTFFDNKSPATFYNAKYADESNNATLAKASGEITSELKDMYDQLEGKKIKLVATLAKNAA